MQYHHAISRRTALQWGGTAVLTGSLVGCGAIDLLPQTTQVDTPTATAAPTAAPTQEPAQNLPTALQSSQYRGIWISYLEWMEADFSSQTAFAAYLATMFDNCVSLGLNTVLVQVRPFGDAFYPSAYFPWSHIITGTQGQAPDFDPLALMIEAAHARALRVEAWVNPYRLRLNETRPETLCAENLYYTNPDWVVAVGEGLYLNPAMPEVAAYVCDGVQEILENYAVDGIHFDDYFYPSTEDNVDEAAFAASGATDRTAWRQANVSALVKRVYDCIKAYDPAITFGISPQGNPDNNLNQQYSDVGAWMNPATGQECVDYVCPQVYWGYNYTMQSGSTRFGYQYIIEEWLSMPRADSVALCFGLGAYRIGDGDGGQNEDSVSQWNSAENLVTMIVDLSEAGADGYALYRYDSLYASAYPNLAAGECHAIAQYNEMMEE